MLIMCVNMLQMTPSNVLLRGSVVMAAISAPDNITPLFVAILSLSVSFIVRWVLYHNNGFITSSSFLELIQELRTILDISYTIFLIAMYGHMLTIIPVCVMICTLVHTKSAENVPWEHNDVRSLARIVSIAASLTSILIARISSDANVNANVSMEAYIGLSIISLIGIDPPQAIFSTIWHIGLSTCKPNMYILIAIACTSALDFRDTQSQKTTPSRDINKILLCAACASCGVLNAASMSDTINTYTVFFSSLLFHGTTKFIIH